MDVSNPHYPQFLKLDQARRGRNAPRYWLGVFKRQWLIILALMIREMKVRYGRSSLGYAMAFVQPLVQKGMLIGLMMLAAEKAPIGTSMVLFYWTGLSAFHKFSFVSNKVVDTLGASRKVRVLPSITPLDYSIVKGSLEFCTDMIITVVGLIIIYMVETEDALPGEPLWVVQSIVLMAFFGYGIGLINSVVAAFFQTWGFIWKAFSGVLMLTSGLFRVPDTVPYAVKQYMQWNPLTHGIELFRMGFYPHVYSDFVDVQYLAIWTFSSLMLGLAMERVFRRRITNRK